MPSFPISYGERVSGGYRNLKLFPFTLLSPRDFMLKVLPAGNVLSLGLLSSVWLFSSPLWSAQGGLWVAVGVLSVGNLIWCLLSPSSGDLRAPQQRQSDTFSVCHHLLPERPFSLSGFALKFLSLPPWTLSSFAVVSESLAMPSSFHCEPHIHSLTVRLSVLGRVLQHFLLPTPFFFLTFVAFLLLLHPTQPI